MKIIHPEDWRPVGVDDLEPAASTAVRSERNTLVVAGPGAGKTELLAQRADFLLRAGVCPAPKRILAISFKREAASNLRERVAERCGVHAHRFDSLTYDAFAKRLLDRFRRGLPEEWRPPANYKVKLPDPHPNELRPYFAKLSFPPTSRPPNFQAMDKNRLKQCFRSAVYEQPIASHGEMRTFKQTICSAWWQNALGHNESASELTFSLITRLAEHLLVTNPYVLKVLRQTYSHVFLDEFQDTNGRHYDLIDRIFRDQDAIITAVGDTKQRIMAWAGALRDVFEQFERDFDAQRVELVRNYRSAPALVEMQARITELIGEDSPDIEAFGTHETDGSCEVWEFESSQAEAEWLAEWIRHEVENNGRAPRDFAIIVRQRCTDMSQLVIDALQDVGIHARDESVLQDLLVEPPIEMLMALLCLGTRKRDQDAWMKLSEHLEWLFIGGASAADMTDVPVEAERLTKRARELVADYESERLDLESLSHSLIDEIGAEFIKGGYPKYRQGDFLDRRVSDFATELKNHRDRFGSLIEAITILRGDNVVPAMTIHKSKGLEFHTVIFVGLEDASWWTYKDGPSEERRNFFVAFSRAMQRVVFTFAGRRDSGFGLQAQHRHEITDLYDVLERAGVTILKPTELAN